MMTTTQMTIIALIFVGFFSSYLTGVGLAHREESSKTRNQSYVLLFFSIMIFAVIVMLVLDLKYS